MGNRSVTQNPPLFLIALQSVSCDRGQVCRSPLRGRGRSGSSYTRALKHSRANPSSASPGWIGSTDPPLHSLERPRSVCMSHLRSSAHCQWPRSQDVKSQRRILINFQETVVAWPSGGCSLRYPRCLWTRWSHIHCSHDTEAQSCLLTSHQSLVCRGENKNKTKTLTHTNNFHCSLLQLHQSVIGP